MSDNMLAKLTSPKWLKEAFSGRARNFVNSFNFNPSIIDREVAGEAPGLAFAELGRKSFQNCPGDIC